jgi:hypothetical protein
MRTSKHVTSGKVIHNAQDDDKSMPSATVRAGVLDLNAAGHCARPADSGDGLRRAGH